MSGKISRREALGKIGLLAATAASNLYGTPPLHGNGNSGGGADYDRLGEVRYMLDKYGAPYNSRIFNAAERIWFPGHKEGRLSILPSEGKSVDVEIEFQYQGPAYQVGAPRTVRANDISDPYDLHFEFPSGLPERLEYVLRYRESGGRWEESAKRTVKTPNSDAKHEPIVVIFPGDLHMPDDWPNHLLNENKDLKKMVRSGKYVNELFVKNLIDNPSWLPGSDERLMFGYNAASMISYIFKNENPDFIVDLGDLDIGFGHKREYLTGKKQHEMSQGEHDLLTHERSMATRILYSLLSPGVQITMIQGNHDGECSWTHSTRDRAIECRKKHWPFKDDNYKGGAPDGNQSYYSIDWGRNSELLLVALDMFGYNPNMPKRPEEWTLGDEQYNWALNEIGGDAIVKMLGWHHGNGWFTQSNCLLPGQYKNDGKLQGEVKHAYGRGMMFTPEQVGIHNKILEDHGLSDMCIDTSKMEDLRLIEEMKKYGLNGIVMGHDHVFDRRGMGKNNLDGEVYAICCGSPKWATEMQWKNGAFWKNDEIGYPSSKDPPGYLKATIFPYDGKIKFEYAVAAPVLDPNSNLGGYRSPGNVVGGFILQT